MNYNFSTITPYTEQFKEGIQWFKAQKQCNSTEQFYLKKEKKRRLDYSAARKDMTLKFWNIEIFYIHS
mgnify:CR=1 FL=1